ncbi:probable serine/threonine-protein kinase nek3 isoform X9 [Drosophila albomicans]|uniref:Probable serine/threonine-protein kinase nek3 isoform X9 n=1 Tax=Drosophila albomicans TaxID=7291 RepID=A0A6P8X8C5_DROAB|nr:probable serine/threonine-protein kinase nek3 isoform X9 [Drosophila albomicans]
MGLMRSLCCCLGRSKSERGASEPGYHKCPEDEEQVQEQSQEQTQEQEGAKENSAAAVVTTEQNEIEQSLAAAISDRATDEVLEALTRYRRGLGIAESPSVLLDEPQTPDIVRSRSSHEAEGLIIRPGGRGSVLPKLGLESPTATPHLPTKRRSVARKVRPQSVVENLSLSHIPDLLESPSSHRSSSQLSSRGAASATGASSAMNANHMSDSIAAIDDGGVDECCDSITELPSASFQLQHLVKGRPKRAKTRAPTRPLVSAECVVGVSRDIGDGLEHFFRPGSVTPTTLTPLVSPTSEECSSLSFVDSPTMSRDGNGHMTSEETTPILEERRPIKLERQSPLLKSASWATRSRSTDNLEKYSPLVGRKSPLVKMRTEGGAGNEEIAAATAVSNSGLLKAANRDDKMRSPSSDSIKSHVVDGSNIVVKTGNGILRTPIALQKPRPWSVVGSEPKSEQLTGNGSVDSTKTTPDVLDEDVEVLHFGQSVSGSIVGITPGIALAAGGSGGGSIVGITPGAALEKKSVRELAAGLSRLDLPLKPPIMPRTMLNQVNRSSNISNSSNLSNNSNNSSNSTTTTTTTTTTTVLNNQTRSKIISTSSTNNETQETLSKTIITEHGSSSSTTNKSTEHAMACASLISNEILSMRNGQVASKSGSCAESNVKRIAGKEISTLFEV